MATRAEDLFQQLITKGESAIDELIVSRKTEELFLDFKRSADAGDGRHLHEKDNATFGRAISGFGNSEGGIIVWGVDCSRAFDGADVASLKSPIKDAAAFTSKLEAAVTRCTIPPHSGVRSVAITRAGALDGFVVSLIPKSNTAPHQTVARLQYYMRAGSDFMPVPHAILAGMFGRRPQPSVGIMRIISPAEIDGDAITFRIALAIRNEGPGIARDIFLTLIGSSMPCPVGSLEFESTDLVNWIVLQSLGVHMSYMSKPDVRLAPDSQIMPCQLNFRIFPEFTSALEIKGKIGCEGAMPISFQFENTAEKIELAYKGILHRRALGFPIEQELRRFPKDVLGIDAPNQ